MDPCHDELLIRLDERTKKIAEMLESHLRKAENGGWNRCVLRGEKLDGIKSGLDEHIKGHVWLNRTIGAAAITSTGALAVALIVYFLG